MSKKNVHFMPVPIETVLNISHVAGYGIYLDISISFSKMIVWIPLPFTVTSYHTMICPEKYLKQRNKKSMKVLNELDKR